MRKDINERKSIIDFLTKVSKSASSNCEDEANVLIDMFIVALKSVSPMVRQNILNNIASDYRMSAPILFEQEKQELPF
jgi:hypothetical protein